jgi:glycosyltransferase involved in cell wall biosynthesis
LRFKYQIKVRVTFSSSASPLVHPEDSKRYLEYEFPGLRVFRIRYSINEKLYYPEAKKKQICLMPRKNVEDVKQVLHILGNRKELEGWEVVLIDKMSEARAAAVMRESAVFLSFAGPEGFGLPAAEAMKCGCVVAGYTGRGGDEFMRPEFCFPIAFVDIVGYAQTAERILKKYAADAGGFAEMTEKAAGFIAENYSQERERESIIDCWKKI